MKLTLSEVLKPGMKGAFYGRHSTDKQTMDTQRSMAYDLAEKYRCNIVKDYMDAGVSARKKTIEERQGIDSLLKDAMNKQFDFVAICNHDRIARKPAEHQRIRLHMAAHQIPIVICSSETLYDSGDFIVDLIKDGVSKLEVDNTRTRTHDTARTLAKTGKWTGGKAPFGYRYNKETKSIMAVDEELDIVKRIYALYKNKEGFESIAKIVTKEFGTTFQKTHVRWILTNPFYAGYTSLYRTKENSRNTITPIEDWLMVPNERIPARMTLDEWKETWAIYEQRKNGNISPNQFKTSFLLSNLVTCSDCGNRLSCKDQTTFDKKRGKHYGKNIYCCIDCQYKIEADRLHKIIDVVISDIKARNRNQLVKDITQGFQVDKSKLMKYVDNDEIKARECNQKIYQIEEAINTLMKPMKEMDPDSHEVKLVRILIMNKEKIHRDLSQLEQTIKKNKRTLSYIDEIQMKQDSISDMLTKVPDTIVDTDNIELRKELRKELRIELRKMLVYLIEDVTIQVKSKEGNGNVSQALVSIKSRHNLIETTF